MCITVERAHIEQLRQSINASITKILDDVSERSEEFLLKLKPPAASAAIVFRDFPKAHGLIIQRAVGIALDSHVGGYSETEKRFKFLSGCQVKIDNFFLHNSGQIHLIETKRDMATVRKSAAEVAGRTLHEVAMEIERHVRNATGKRLRHKIRCAFFSYVDENRNEEISINVGTNSKPRKVGFPIYGRRQINELVGQCLGEFITYFDDMVGREISNRVQGIALRPDKKLSDNPLIDRNSGKSTIRFGGSESAPATVERFLS
jgi:hypothetical protein